ncbi:MAG: hypothetical protein UX13_C0026G0030 [Candidatus Woesebacteria bacterium GW2011_GWB1_45_5]|uniref:HTH cro/C1-type domain-containing protein n=1 Tax=Candidatus Woesebacteria bacterium GW2011_GWB1_45_5 TaxID=1618581 RepID=A0A0G1MP02_9BACT|nr:MAG: hypothetical protein UX13_C0026G0030 [Candidatus Woesebacteria bacterium GW2011_GWB1_45_5]
MLLVERLQKWLKKDPGPDWELLSIPLSDMEDSIDRGFDREIYHSVHNELGFFFSMTRLDLGLTVDELSKTSGVNRNDIIDLELGSFYLPEATQVAEKLKDSLKIDDETFKKALLANAVKK